MSKNRKIIGKLCLKCQEFIDPKEHYVQLSTYNRSSSSDDHQFFHFNCWEIYFNNCVMKKTKANIEFMQSKAIKLFESPAIKNLLEQVKGSEMALNMLKMPLNSSISKIQDDRKKGKRRKEKMPKV